MRCQNTRRAGNNHKGTCHAKILNGDWYLTVEHPVFITCIAEEALVLFVVLNVEVLNLMETTVVVAHKEFVRVYLCVVIVEAGEGVCNADGLPFLWLHILPFFLRHIQLDICRLLHILVHEVVAVVH